MDEVNNFLNDTYSKKITLRGPQTSGMLVTKDDISTQFSRRSDKRPAARLEEENMCSGVDYAKEFRRKDDQACQEMTPGSEAGMLDQMENLSSAYDLDSADHMLSDLQLTEVYSKYSFKRAVRDSLPIDSIKDEVLSLLASNSVLIIEGPTGCGKTTQVPQWILEDCYERRRHCNIAVTQPRRIAAISIAKRVAQERACEMGSLVGYQVGLDNKTTTDTRLHYMTTGILLQKFVSAKNMNAYTHVILDEIHERGQEMDFLLLVVKKLLRTVSRGVKVLLMSATFDSAQFMSYFNVAAVPGLYGTGYCKLDGRGGFRNTTYFLEQLRRFRNLPDIKYEEPGVTPQGYELVVRLLSQFEEIDAKEDADEKDKVPPAVLVFLPGIHEIEELANCLEDKSYRERILEKRCPDLKWWVVPLHSTITSAEQARAFQKPPPGLRKVILATNIAESSITVPDIKYVIDFCLMKVLVLDPETHFTSLQTQWASRANCEQRAGRAGRVRQGRVYRLVSKEIYKEKFAKECTPEMERCPLERLVLLAKMLDMGPPKQILALAMNPPRLENIRNTVLVLKEVGGLLKTLNGEMSYEDGDITYLGRIMAKLPVDIRVAKLIMLGYIFGCLEPTIIMGAAMTVKNVFSTPFGARLNAYSSKLTWAGGSRSDCIAFLNLYKVWRYLNSTRYFGRGSNQSEGRWACDMYAQLRALKELDDMVRELSCRLSREGIDEIKSQESVWTPAELPLILKVLLTGAFYPHYFVQQAGDEQRERDAIKQLGGLDPATTVYLKDFPPEQPRELYAAAIQRAVKELIVDEPRVSFDNNSNKVFLMFTSSGEMDDHYNSSKKATIPGRVALPVYKAVKARQLNLDIAVRCLPPKRASEVVAALGPRSRHVLCGATLRLPAISDSCFSVLVSHVIDVGHFWIQHSDESTARELAWLHSELNERPLLALTETVRPATVCAAPYRDQGDAPAATYHRAVVHKVLPKDLVWVFYSDFGNYGCVSASTLRELPGGACAELPPLAVECTLTEVAPSPLRAQSGWCPEALSFFTHFVQANKTLYGKVYSVAHGVVSLDLQTREGVSLAGELVRRGFARVCEESYDSKLNHDLRELAHEMTLTQQKALTEQQAERAARAPHDVPLPPAAEFTHTVHLKGPFSPLERSLHNMMYGGLGKQVQIEWNSVNAVLLDTDPQEPYERLVVAAMVGQNTEGSKLTLRHTTVLPNVPGLPCIMSMLFAPCIELRRDASRSRYASVLCGLGAEPSSAGDVAPIFPDHDLLVNIDVDISIEDLTEINHLRHMMNCMMHCPPGQDQPGVTEAEKSRAPGLARKQILSLLTKRRRHREFQAVPHAWEWGSAPEAELQSMRTELEDAVYPLHDALRLRPLDPQLRRRQQDENKKLHDAVTRYAAGGLKNEVVCSLCGVGPMDLQSLRIHLYSRTHRDKEDELNLP